MNCFACFADFGFDKDKSSDFTSLGMLDAPWKCSSIHDVPAFAKMYLCLKYF